MDIEKDSITDLRLLLNKEPIERETFWKIHTLIKTFKHLIKVAQKNS